jgi:hypothetical protein
MSEVADVVSSSRLFESLAKALPELEVNARFESVETAGSGDLIRKLQKALPEIRNERENPGVMVSFRDETSAQLQSFLAAQSASLGKVGPVTPGGLEAKFDSHDILGWFGSFFSWWKKISPHPWLTDDSQPGSFPDVARIALISDWGTGLYGAPACAQSIEADKAGFAMVMHLGDVYYSGDAPEMKSRFLDLWPKVNGAISRGLNGNHEMYTGGEAYFDTALKFFGQSGSYFAMQNNHWLLAALDTSYTDQDLFGDQAAWLDKLISQAGDRRVVLFSHHQPFSLLDNPAPKVVSKLEHHLEAKRIHAWYFGHEHRCVIYDKHPTWNVRGRCIGHSGFPEFRKPEWGVAPAETTWLRLNGTSVTPAAVLLDGRNPFITGHESEYGPHGYVTIQFENTKLTECYFLADGTPTKSQEIS